MCLPRPVRGLCSWAAGNGLVVMKTLAVVIDPNSVSCSTVQKPRATTLLESWYITQLYLPANLAFAQMLAGSGSCGELNPDVAAVCHRRPPLRCICPHLRRKRPHSSSQSVHTGWEARSLVDSDHRSRQQVVHNRLKSYGLCVCFMLLRCHNCTFFEAALHVGLDRYKVVEHATVAQKKEKSKRLPSTRTVAINCLWWRKNPFAVVGLSDCHTRIVDDVGRHISGKR